MRGMSIVWREGRVWFTSVTPCPLLGSSLLCTVSVGGIYLFMGCICNGNCTSVCANNVARHFPSIALASVVCLSVGRLLCQWYVVVPAYISLWQCILRWDWAAKFCSGKEIISSTEKQVSFRTDLINVISEIVFASSASSSCLYDGQAPSAHQHA